MKTEKNWRKHHRTAVTHVSRDCHSVQRDDTLAPHSPNLKFIFGFKTTVASQDGLPSAVNTGISIRTPIQTASQDVVPSREFRKINFPAELP